MTQGWGSEAQAAAAFLGSASAQACGGSTSPGARFLCCRGLDVADPLRLLHGTRAAPGHRQNSGREGRPSSSQTG